MWIASNKDKKQLKTCLELSPRYDGRIAGVIHKARRRINGSRYSYLRQRVDQWRLRDLGRFNVGDGVRIADQLTKVSQQ